MKKYILYIVGIVAGLLISTPAFAETVDYSVTIEPSLTLTIPESSLVLNLDPSSKTFDSKDLSISVGTNNKTGYILTLSTPNDNTDLERDTTADTTAISATIPTLDTGTYTESTFTANKWGYKINANTSIPSTITSGYVPFVSGNTLMESNTAINQDQAELTFAAKIDYLQPAGAYNTTLQFNIVANPLVNYMQDLNPALCTTTPMTVVDNRDNQEYIVQRLEDGNCWMISNLIFTGSSSDSANTMTLNSATSNIASNYTETNPLIITYADQVSSPTATAPRLHVGVTPEGVSTVYYNYRAASAGTSGSTYDICPAGWRLFTRNEFGNILNETAKFAITGGYYSNATLNDFTATGRWWSNTVQDSNTSHFAPCYVKSSNSFNINCGANNSYAAYIRCILK